MRSVGLEHDGFIFDSDEQYVATLVPMLREAAEAGDVVMAVVSAPNIAKLARPLGAAADKVEFAPAEEWYQHPMATIERYSERLRELGPHERGFVVGEVIYNDDPVSWVEWIRYEAVLNRIFADYNARTVCPYDRRTVPESVVTEAGRTHRHLLGETRRPSASYVGPEQVMSSLPRTVVAPSRPADLCVELPSELVDVREEFRRTTRGLDLDEDRLADLTLALNEVVTNSVSHLTASGSLRVWADAAEVVCLVEDDGPGIDPTIGFARPAPWAESGYGLWLARQLFDRVDVVPNAEGTEVALAAAVAEPLSPLGEAPAAR